MRCEASANPRPWPPLALHLRRSGSARRQCDRLQRRSRNDPDNLSARQPDRLARVGAEVSYTQYDNLKQAGAFQDLAFETGLGNLNWDAGGRSEVTWQMTTSANFFDVLGVGASAGRLYSQFDQSLPIALLSYGFWRKRLHSDAGAVGRPLQFNGQLYTILGVLPRDYRSVMGHAPSGRSMLRFYSRRMRIHNCSFASPGARRNGSSPFAMRWPKWTWSRRSMSGRCLTPPRALFFRCVSPRDL